MREDLNYKQVLGFWQAWQENIKSIFVRKTYLMVILHAMIWITQGPQSSLRDQFYILLSALCELCERKYQLITILPAQIFKDGNDLDHTETTEFTKR